jgi:hypothetical protein
MTEAEMLDAIRSAMRVNLTNEPDVVTVTDLQGSLSWSRKRVLDTLRVLISAGKASVCKSFRTDIGGRVLPVVAYRIHP